MIEDLTDDLLAGAGLAKNTKAASLQKAADDLGVDPVDLASIISFESAGTFNPHKVGGEGNRYRGLIQFGPEEQRKYYRPNDTFESQLQNGVVPYFRDRFAKAGRDTNGASLADLYTTVIAGNPGASRNAQDAFGTSANSGVQTILKQHRPQVLKNIFGGQHPISNDLTDSMLAALPQRDLADDMLAGLQERTGIPVAGPTNPVQQTLKTPLPQTAEQPVNVAEPAQPVVPNIGALTPIAQASRAGQLYKPIQKPVAQQTAQPNGRQYAPAEGMPVAGSEAVTYATPDSAIPTLDKNRTPREVNGYETYNVDLSKNRGPVKDYAKSDVINQIAQKHNLNPEAVSQALDEHKVFQFGSKDHPDFTDQDFEKFAGKTMPWNVGADVIDRAAQLTDERRKQFVENQIPKGPELADIERRLKEKATWTDKERADVEDMGLNPNAQYGGIGGASRILNTLAAIGDSFGNFDNMGGAKPAADVLHKYGSMLEEANRINEEKQPGVLSSIIRGVTSAPADIPRFMALSRLPGGNLLAFPIAGALEDIGAKKNPGEIFKDVGTNAVFGAFLHYAPNLGKWAEGAIAQKLAKTGLPEKAQDIVSTVAAKGIQVATVSSGAGGLTLLQGGSATDAAKSFLTMAALDFMSPLEKSGKIKDLDGRVITVVDPSTKETNRLLFTTDGKQTKITNVTSVVPKEASDATIVSQTETPKDLSIGPGTPAVGQTDQSGSDIKQLADAMKNITPESGRDGYDIAAKAADAVSAGKGVVSNGVLKAKALYDWYTKRPEVTDYKKQYGEYDFASQRSASENRDFVDSIEKAVPSKTTREALTNFIQAGGDATKLKAQADASSGSLKAGYEQALKLTDDEKNLATNISSYFDSKLEEGKKAGVIHGTIENYVNQVFKKPDSINAQLIADYQRSLLDPNFKFDRKRIFESFFEGEQAGFKPQTKDIGQLVAHYDKAFQKALLARQFVKKLQGVKASDGRPAVALTGSGTEVEGETPDDASVLIKPHTKSAETGDFKVIDSPALRGWKWVGKGENGKDVFLEGDLAVHPEIYTHLKNTFGESFFNKYAALRTVKTINSTIKQTMLSLSGFHQVQEGVHALGHRVSPINAGGKDFKIDFDDPKQATLLKHGLQVASYDGLEAFSDGLTGGNLINKTPVVGKYFQRYQNWLFKEYIPRLKMVMGLHALERNTQRYEGKLDKDQIAEMTAQQANAAFGELNYRYMGRNPSLQDALRTFLLAPDFLEARGRFVGQALKPFGKEQLTALGLLAATQYFTARVANKVLDDDYHWSPEDAFRVYHGGRWYGLRTVPGDLIHLATDPRGFAYNRLAPLAKAGVTALTGRNAFGEKVDPEEQVKDVATSGLPMSLRGILNPRSDDKWWEPAINAIGLQEGKEHTEADKVISKYYDQKYPSGFPKPDDPKKAQLKKDVLLKLRLGNESEETEAQLQSLLDDGSLTRTEMEALEKKSKLTPLQVRVKGLPATVALDVWNASTPAEKNQIQDILTRKLRSAVKRKTMKQADVPDDLR